MPKRKWPHGQADYDCDYGWCSDSYGEWDNCHDEQGCNSYGDWQSYHNDDHYPDEDGDDGTIVYHGTSKNRAKKIMRGGFSPSEDGLLGGGVYSTTDKSKAAAFANQFGKNARIVVASADLGSVATVDATDARHGGYSETAWQWSHDTAYTPSGEGVARSEYCTQDTSRITPLQVELVPKKLRGHCAHAGDEDVNDWGW